MLGEWHRDQRDQQGFSNRDGGPKLIRFESPKSSSSPPRSSGAARTKNDAQAAYGVQFERSLYAWKDNFVEFPMELVSGPNSIGVDRNHQNKWTSKIYQGAATHLLGPLGMCPGGYAHPKPHIISSHCLIRVWGFV